MLYFQGDDNTVISLFQDVSDKRRVEIRLKEKEQFIHRALNTSFAGIYIFNLLNRTNEFINAAYTKITGYTLDDINSMNPEAFGALFHPEDVALALRHMEEVTGCKDKGFEIEYRFKHKQGHWIWYLSKDAVFDFGDDGKVSKYIGSFLDITEQKNKELELDKTLKKLELIMAGTSDGFWHWIDHDKDIVEWNDRMFEMLGYKPQAFQPSAKKFFGLLHSDDIPILQKALTEAVNLQSYLMSNIGFEQTIMAFDGTVVKEPPIMTRRASWLK